MASEEMRKKWGTIFMGEREASVEQLNAMQEPLRREKQQKEQAEDYMERVRQRAADRAREILGAAYAERQKVLDEAKAEALVQKKHAAQECAKLRAEGEVARKQAHAELEKAKEERMEAEKLRAAAHDEGFQAGMDQAGTELHEFRAELGQSVASVLHALERERKNILAAWRDDLVELVKCATQAATGHVLDSEHQTILRALVFKALDLLENRSIVTIKVNPADEAAVSDMFRAARERFPELKQWVVTGDPQIESGGLVAESGSGSVDLKRENFRVMVDDILCHLSLPEQAAEVEREHDVRDMVEKEVAHIAGLTPEPDFPIPETADDDTVSMDEAPAEEHMDTAGEEYEEDDAANPSPEEAEDAELETTGEELPEENSLEAQPDIMAEEPQTVTETAQSANDSPSIEELEEELFPLDEESMNDNPAPIQEHTVTQVESPLQEPKETELADPKTLAEGGFL